MDIRIAGTAEESIVDGPGFRFTVFAQGCGHNCPGCHNPATHDFAGGTVINCDELLKSMADNPLLDALTLSGGEPFEQPEPCAYLARGAKELGLGVWAYSGYTFEELIQKPECLPLLKECDVLVDGRFVLSQRTLELRFRGSKNQRLIDLNKSLEKGEAVLFPLA